MAIALLVSHPRLPSLAFNESSVPTDRASEDRYKSLIEGVGDMVTVYFTELPEKAVEVSHAVWN